MTTIESPLFVADVTLRSRLWSGSAALWPASDGFAQQALAQSYAQGLNAVVMLPVAVRRDGKSTPAELLLSAHQDWQNLRMSCADILAQGAQPLVELRHGGPRAGDLTETRPLGPPIEVRDPINQRRSQQQSPEQVQQLNADYVRAAEKALAAGATLLGLELRDGNFWQHWVSPSGHPVETSAEQRIAPLHDLVRQLSAMAPLIINLAIQDLAPQGLSVTSGLKLAQALVVAGAAALILSVGGRQSRGLARAIRPPKQITEGRYGALTLLAKKHLSVPVGLLGGMRSRLAIDRLLHEKADFVVLERPFACQPKLGTEIVHRDWCSACSSWQDCLYQDPVTTTKCPKSCTRLWAHLESDEY